jgi:predicted RNase H-like HicB family nuclease
MGESVRVTIVYDSGEDGPNVASIPDIHGARGQGHTREEARGEPDRRKAEATNSA